VECHPVRPTTCRHHARQTEMPHVSLNRAHPSLPKSSSPRSFTLSPLLSLHPPRPSNVPASAFFWVLRAFVASPLFFDRFSLRFHPHPSHVAPPFCGYFPPCPANSLNGFFPFQGLFSGGPTNRHRRYEGLMRSPVGPHPLLFFAMNPPLPSLLR